MRTNCNRHFGKEKKIPVKKFYFLFPGIITSKKAFALVITSPKKKKKKHIYDFEIVMVVMMM